MIKKLLIPSLLWLVSSSLSGCGGKEEPSSGLNVLVDCKEINTGVISESITPVSATFETSFEYNVEIHVSADEQTIKEAISQIQRTGQPGYIDNDFPNIRTLHLDFVSRATLYNLEINSTYYYVGVEIDWNHDEIRITPIKKFTTSAIDLHVDLEGSDVIWCGVNFLKDRHSYEENQFLKSTLYSQNTLPSPSEETIEGKWRYPSKDEISQLCNICQITLLDYELNLARLTDSKGTHLYVPFTWSVPHKIGWSAICFPSEGGEYGISLNINPIGNTSMGKTNGSPFFGDALDKLPEKDAICLENNIYQWKYSERFNNEVKEYSGTAERAVRFVMDK